LPAYSAAPRAPRYSSDVDAQNHATSGFIKRAPAPYAHFARYDVLSAGHMVPADQGASALEMVRELTGLKTY
jgi:carboxypeptidase C (cathepsin A)